MYTTDIEVPNQLSNQINSVSLDSIIQITDKNLPQNDQKKTPENTLRRTSLDFSLDKGQILKVKNFGEENDTVLNMKTDKKLDDFKKNCKSYEYELKNLLISKKSYSWCNLKKFSKDSKASLIDNATKNI